MGLLMPHEKHRGPAKEQMQISFPHSASVTSLSVPLMSTRKHVRDRPDLVVLHAQRHADTRVVLGTRTQIIKDRDTASVGAQ